MIKYLYDLRLRPYLPSKISVHNGVGRRAIKIFDRTEVYPDYEKELIRSIRIFVETGDDVVIVGGGKGVSSVVAARKSAPSGFVTAYEPLTERARNIRETAEINAMSDLITVKNQGVGDIVETPETQSEYVVERPENLPPADVLVLDCEGAELEILKNVDLPPKVIVETHGIFGSPTEEIQNVLDGRVSITHQEPIREEDDIQILTGKRADI